MGAMTTLSLVRKQKSVDSTTATATTTKKNPRQLKEKKVVTMACLEPIKSHLSGMLARFSLLPSSSSPANARSPSPASPFTRRSWPMSILSRNPLASIHKGSSSYRPLSDTMPVDSFSIESLVADNPQELAASRRGRSKTAHMGTGPHSSGPIIVDSTSRRSMNLVGTSSTVTPPTPKRADTEPSPTDNANFHCDLGAGIASTAPGLVSPPVQWGQIVYEPKCARSPSVPCSSPSNRSIAVLPMDLDCDRTRSRTPSPARKFAWDALVPWHSGLGPRQMSEYNTLDELPPLDPVSTPPTHRHVAPAIHRPSLVASP